MRETSVSHENLQTSESERKGAEPVTRAASFGEVLQRYRGGLADPAADRLAEVEPEAGQGAEVDPEADQEAEAEPEADQEAEVEPEADQGAEVELEGDQRLSAKELQRADRELRAAPPGAWPSLQPPELIDGSAHSRQAGEQELDRTLPQKSNPADERSNISNLDSAPDRQDRGDGRDQGGRYAGAKGSGKEYEAEGLRQMGEAIGGEVIMKQVHARLPGAPNTRKYDGLVSLPDGRYLGLEIKSGSGGRKAKPRNSKQAAFDARVVLGEAATATLDGRKISICAVITHNIEEGSSERFRD